MPDPDHTPLAGKRAAIPASLLFGGLAALVLLLVMAVELWRGYEQYRVLSSLSQVQQRSIPDALEAQRMVRNLEAVRLEGERILAQPAVRQRLQSMYVIDVIVESPRGREDTRIAPALRQARERLVEISRNEPITDADRGRWAVESMALARLADQITGESIDRLNSDVEQMHRAVDRGLWQLGVSLAVLTVSLAGFVFVLYVVIIRPLRRINTVLEAVLRGNPRRASDGPKSARTREVGNIQQAIHRLETLMQENAAIRAGLEESASTDGLTGLRNRRHFMQEAQTAFARARRSGGPMVIAIADLDHFKAVNDNFGHAAGDVVLKQVAGCIRQTLRETDLYCRYGGEEFAFLFPDTAMAEAGVLANRLREAVAQTAIDIGASRALSITLSMGLAQVHELELEAALKLADEAMYRAKISGRNRIEHAAGLNADA